MQVKILLQFMQAAHQRTICDAGIVGEREVAGDLANLCQSLSRAIVLGFHHPDRIGEWAKWRSRWRRASGRRGLDGRNRWEEDSLFLEHVHLELRPEAGINLRQTREGRAVPLVIDAVDLLQPIGQGLKLALEVLVVGADDVVG